MVFSSPFGIALICFDSPLGNMIFEAFLMIFQCFYINFNCFQYIILSVFERILCINYTFIILCLKINAGSKSMMNPLVRINWLPCVLVVTGTTVVLWEISKKKLIISVPCTGTVHTWYQTTGIIKYNWWYIYWYFI